MKRSKGELYLKHTRNSKRARRARARARETSEQLAMESLSDSEEDASGFIMELSQLLCEKARKLGAKSGSTSRSTLSSRKKNLEKEGLLVL